MAEGGQLILDEFDLDLMLVVNPLLKVRFVARCINGIEVMVDATHHYRLLHNGRVFTTEVLLKAKTLSARV